MYALQDEPERKRRPAVLIAAGVFALSMQGGGLIAAHRYEPPPKPQKSILIEMALFQPPPPPKPEPAPAPEPEPEPEKKPEPKPKPKPKPKAKPKPKPKPEPKPDPPPDPIDVPPEPPKPAAKKPPMLIPGLELGSTVNSGAGAKFSTGNTRMGKVARRATDPNAVEKVAPRAFEPTPEPARDPVIEPPEEIDCGKPPYTVAAQREGVEGRQIIRIRVNARGIVSKVQVIKGLGFGLDKSVVAHYQRCRFRPKRIDGKAVAGSLRKTITYVLED